MKRNEINIYKEEIRRLYYDERMSLEKVASTIGINMHTIWSAMKRWSFECRNLGDSHNLQFDKKFFDVIDTEQKAYFLGFIAADGNVHKKTFQIGLNKRDEHILLSLKEALKAEYNVKTEREVVRRFTITNPYFTDALKRKGIVERKTFVLEFPSEEIVPSHLLRHYLRGYFDGDGCIKFIIEKQYNKIHWCFEVISNLNFITGYAKAINSLIQRDSEPAIRKEKRRVNPIYYFSIGSSSDTILNKLYELFYKDATVYLFRKKEKFEQIQKIIHEQKLFG